MTISLDVVWTCLIVIIAVMAIMAFFGFARAR